MPIPPLIQKLIVALARPVPILGFSWFPLCFLYFASCIFLFSASANESQEIDSSNLYVERITAVAPFPRGLAIVNDDLYVLSRGRVGGAGGVSTELLDRAGTIYRVDPGLAQPVDGPIDPAIRANGIPFAEPTDPPFNLFNHDVAAPPDDRWTDRPYCTLRWHEPTQSFYICAFSGIDMPRRPGHRSFSKNLTDAVLRYDLRTQSWHEVERHDIMAGGNYPHHDPAAAPPPHGWLNGPDNCLPVGNGLYVVGKDNSLLVRYDLSALVGDPHAGPPPSQWILGAEVHLKNLGPREFFGHSMLAAHDNYFYLGYRTSSVIIRFPLGPDGFPVQPIQAELVARFDPYDPATGASANLTDMAFDSRGHLYVISAKPSRVYRFAPDPADPFDGRTGASPPWADLASLTSNPNMKSENVLVDKDGRVYVTSGDGYVQDGGLHGVVYRITEGS